MADFNSGLYNLIGEKIKTLRIQNGFNQDQLSKLVGIGRTSISNIELGRHQAPLHLIYKICKELKAEIHSVIPTIAEINEALETSGSDLIEQLNRKNIPDVSKRNIESYIQKM